MKGKIKQNHCVIWILHSDFPYSYTFSWVGAVQTTSPAPRRAKNNLRVTMIQCLPSANCRSVFSAYASIFLRKTDRPTGRKGSLRTRPQDDIVEQSSTVGSASAAEHRRFPRKTVRVDGQVRFVGLRPPSPLHCECVHSVLLFVYIAT